MKKLLLTSILLTSALCAYTEDSSTILESKQVTQGAIWRYGLDRAGVNNTKGVPVKNGEKWRTKIGGQVLSSPVFFDGIIYTGSDKGFFALDAESGKEVWSLGIKEGRDKEYQGVVSSACIADGFVYFTAGDGQLYSVDMKTGKVKWSVSPKKSQNKIVAFSPAVAYGLVFSKGGNREISGFDVETGKEVWHGRDRSPATAGVTVTKDFLIGFSPAGVGCRVVNINSAIQLPKNFMPSLAYSCSTPAVVNNSVYGTCAALIGTAPRYPVVALASLESNVYVTKSIEPHKEKKEMKAVFSSTTVWGGSVFIGCDSGHLYVYDDKQLDPLWNFKTGGPVRSSASISSQDGIVYFSSYDGKLYALNAKTGEQQWDHTISSPTKVPSYINSCPWVEDGSVYIGTIDGEIVAIH